MNKLMTGLALVMVSMSIAHVDLSSKQALEATKARISMLKAKIDAQKSEETQIENSIESLKKNGRNAAQLSLLVTRLTVIKNETEKLKDALRVKENALKPLLSITR